MMRCSAGLIEVKVVSIAPAARAQFTGEQSDYCQLRPLGKAKRLEELFLGVLKGGSDRIYGGELQADTSASMEWGRKYCKPGNGSNEFCRRGSASVSGHLRPRDCPLRAPRRSVPATRRSASEPNRTATGAAPSGRESFSPARARD